METFIYYLGAFTFSAGIAWAALAAIDFIENGGKEK